VQKKQNPSDLVLFAAGVGLIFGSFSPWISVLIVNIAGVDGFFGFVTLTSGIVLMLYASSKLWPNLLDERYSSKLGLVAPIAAGASLCSLIYVAVRIRQVAGEFSDIEETEPATPSGDDLFGDIAGAIDEFTQSLADAFRPRLAMGWYVCMLSALVAFAVICLRFRKPRASNPSDC